MHFHSYSMEAIGEIVFRRSDKLNPQGFKVPSGGEAFARIRLSRPGLLLPGDRFILRQFSPVVTIGGGEVLDTAPASRDLPDADVLEILAGQNRQAILRARIWRHHHDGAYLRDLIAETGWTKSTIERELAEALKTKQVVRIDDVFLVGEAWERLKQQFVPTLEQFHRENPLLEGISRTELQDRTDASNDTVFEALLQTLVREKKIEVAGDLVRLPGRGVVMKDEEAESKKTIEDAFATAGLKVPALHEVLAGLKIDRGRAQKIVTLLLRDRVLIKISDELVFHRSALEQLRVQIAARKAKSPVIDVAAFKEMTGVSRKYAIPLLEYLDRERVTRRVGDSRQIL